MLGAIIDLGNCLDLITRKDVPLIQTSYRMLRSQIEATDGKMPVNSDPEATRIPTNWFASWIAPLSTMSTRSSRKPPFRHSPRFEGYSPKVMKSTMALAFMSVPIRRLLFAMMPALRGSSFRGAKRQH